MSVMNVKISTPDENRKQENILNFDDFINSNEKGEIPKVVRGGYIKIREDYINSFINEHEPDHELHEEE